MVILGPGHVGHLTLVTLQHVQVGKRDRVVHVDCVLNIKQRLTIFGDWMTTFNPFFGSRNIGMGKHRA